MNEPTSPSPQDVQELAALEAGINRLLPPRYVGCFEDVPPTSMGSAALRYDAQGRVAWGSIWTTFCHLALAGGPPHRGRWLAPVTAEEIAAAPTEYEAVVAELQRALRLCIDLPLSSQRPPGWIGLECDDPATASWLVRAIVAENVAARHKGPVLFVPAGPQFRVEKEIRNVVVAAAKTCHYLLDHVDDDRKPSGAAPLLICPPLPHEIAAAGPRYEQAVARLRQSIAEATGLATLEGAALGWVGIECESEEAAVWLLRATAVDDIVVRRENAVLYVPVELPTEMGGGIAKTAAAVARAHRLRQVRVAND